MANNRQPDKSNLIVPIAIIAAIIPIVGGLIWYLERGPADTGAPAALTSDAKSYIGNLGLSGVDMKATANYVGATVVEITGKITNRGDRALNVVELTCVFYDPYGQVVLRERVQIVKRRLEPGQTSDFRLPFEGIPGSWNQALPQLVIAHIGFAA